MRSDAHPAFVLRCFTAGVLVIVCLSGLVRWLLDFDTLCCLPAASLCPFRAITGFPCPGCGMTQAFLCLGQLRVAEATSLNPFSIMLLMIMITFTWKGRIPQWLQHESFVVPACAIVITVWLMRI